MKPFFSFLFLFIGTALFYYAFYTFLSKDRLYRFFLSRIPQCSTSFFAKSHFLKRFGSFRIFSPGFFVRNFSDYERLETLLIFSGRPFQLQLEEYCRLKQSVIFVVSWSVFFCVFIFGHLVNALLFELFLIFAIIKIPDLFLVMLSKKRANTVERELPHFIDLLSMATEAGMNVYMAFEQVGEKTRGILGQEIRRIHRKIASGFSLDSALTDLNTFIDSSELARFIFAIQQSKKLGVSLSKTLRIQAQLMRNKRRQKAQELSKTAAVKITIPLVFLIFPALLLIYIGPGILRLLYN